MKGDSGRLAAFLRPDSIAVVGAGDRPTSSGGAVLQNLRICGWPGRVVPVNPKGGTIQGLPAARSLREVQPPADLVAILVKPESILDVVHEAAATGHRNLLVLPGGFSEAGEAGRARDAALRALAEEHGLLVGGPNCAGLINLMDSGRPFAATFLRDMPRGGAVAAVSQSGAIAEELIAASHRMGIPLGAVVSVGNSMQLDLAAYLEYLGGDDSCRAVLLYVESFGDRERFASVARQVAMRKPVVAVVAGRTPPGREAALRHTGSQALSSAEADAFCASAGILRVPSLRHLCLAGKAFARHHTGIGPRVLILSNSGGPGVLATDQASLEGLQIVPLAPALTEALQAALPAEAAVANPLDLLADARDDRFGTVLRSALELMAGEVDAILMIHVVPFMVDADPVVETLATIASAARIPLMHSMMGTLPKRDSWFARLETAGVPAFDDSEEMCMAAGMLMRYRLLRDGPY